MIPAVRFEKSGLRTSRLAFGLSRLHHMPSSDERQRLLALAADLGFRHFDAARAYGDGLAEAELGKFLHRRRQNFTVATKYGIPAHPLIERMPVMRTAVAGTRMIARKVGWPNNRPPITSQGLQKSIERSLRTLAIDTLDILFLHEPKIELVSRPDELLAEMRRQKSAGKVRHFGLAGGYHACSEVFPLLMPMMDVLQTSESDWKADQLVPDLTFGAMRRGPQSRLEKPLDTQLALEHLTAALQRRPNGAIVISSRHPDHLHALADIAAGSVA